MARNPNRMKVSSSVSGPLRKAGFEIGQTGGSVFLWGSRIEDGTDVLITYRDNEIDGDPTKHEWNVLRSDVSGDGFVLIEGLRLDEAISLARRLPEPRGREITVTAGAERDGDDALAIAVEMAAGQQPSP